MAELIPGEVSQVLHQMDLPDWEATQKETFKKQIIQLAEKDQPVRKLISKSNLFLFLHMAWGDGDGHGLGFYTEITEQYSSSGAFWDHLLGLNIKFKILSFQIIESKLSSSTSYRLRLPVQ